MADLAREHEVVKASVIGIVVNLLLTVLKGGAGLVAGSIAVVLDALNSLTDAFSSIATIIGAKISTRRPSREHPYGYGRVEYVTSTLIAVIIIVAGIISLRESILKIITPSEPDYSTITLVILIVATLTKIVLGVYFVKKGKTFESQPLKASGIDALYDAILTFGTFIAAIICLVWDVDLDGWIGAVISLFVVKAGIDVLREAVDSIIGERPDKEKANAIRQLIAEHEGVLGVFDLLIDNFGPEYMLVNCRIEVRDDMLASEVHEITRHISEDLYSDFNAIATIGIYAANPKEEFREMNHKLHEIVDHHPEILQVHGFYVDEPLMRVSFDLVVDFDHDADEIKSHIVDEMKECYPDYDFNVVTDIDYSLDETDIS